jgi:predicted TIM-barrel fold metal-dependent hydrolase
MKEWMLEHPLTHWIIRFITFVIPGQAYDKMHEMQAILRKNINDVAGVLVAEMDEAGIVMTTPLMMDLEIPSLNQKAEVPYPFQVTMVSEIAARYPGRIMPFIMYDPRKPSAFKLIKRAVEEMGYLGVKLYPALGYHPDPRSYYNNVETNEELKQIYDYCEQEQIPITAHCSPGGSYSGEFLHNKDLILQMTDPANWEMVLKKHPKLRLNLSHFGSCLTEVYNDGSWAGVIRELVCKYENAYTDIAYQSKALKKKTQQQYFSLLSEMIEDKDVGPKIIYGTDWPSTRHTWKEKDYLKPFKKNLNDNALQRIGFDNPINFLFPGRKFPQRIKDFYTSKNVAPDKYPAWLKENLKLT